MTVNLTPLENAVDSLEQLLERVYDPDLMSRLDHVTRNGLKAGLIQNFEFTYQLCWKSMRKWIEENIGRDYIDGIARKELFRMSAENQLITDPVKWFRYHEARNLTSRTYNEAQADRTVLVIKEFIADAKQLLQALRAKND
jgi:nucleotidyltransferase substrate binding protein (TIGR01987 family)